MANNPRPRFRQDLTSDSPELNKIQANVAEALQDLQNSSRSYVDAAVAAIPSPTSLQPAMIGLQGADTGGTAFHGNYNYAVDFGTKYNDTLGQVTSLNPFKFTAAVTGYYAFYFQTNIRAYAATVSAIFSLHLNSGAGVLYADANEGINPFASLQLSGVYPLTAGDYLNLTTQILDPAAAGWVVSTNVPNTPGGWIMRVA